MRKYLESIKAPEAPPGPFSVRLKYELKKEFFDRGRSWFPMASAVAAAIMLVLLITVIVQPDLADQVHFAFAPQQIEQSVATETGNRQFLSDEEYSQTVARLQTMSNDSRSPAIHVRDLQDLDPDKSYLIRRTTDDSDRNIYFVSEVRSRPKMY
ncbi:MAG: hypothetical protein K8R90_07760 [Candidatus Cloacimonetes bacterium]|nr:hypothetical protein [Candidatus Cloacimonadota bacterium]